MPLKEGKKFAIRFCSAVFTEINSAKESSVSLLLHYICFTSSKHVHDNFIVLLLLVSKLCVWLQISVSGFTVD